MVYALLECSIESCHLHAIFKTKRAAWKSALKLKKKMVEDALEFRLLEGKRLFRDNYKDQWGVFNLYVEEYEVLK